jgi:energy-coupling factor transport system ATP-binding protein
MKISIEDVVYRYPSDVLALQGVCLDLEHGETVAIIGENGAGKTTLAKHVNGLLRATHGRVLIGDRDTREHTVAQLAKHVGYVFQNPDDQLFARSVRKEVEFGPHNLGLTERELDRRVGTALTITELEQDVDRHPYDLYPSRRKLVAIAATLAMETPIVILDEPTTGQDLRGVALIGRVVERLKAAGRTLITISHDLDFCAEHFERIVVMSQGRILIDGHAESVFAHEDLLQQAGVDPPQMVRLANALKLSSTPRTVEAFVGAWLEQRRSIGGYA